MSKFRYTKLQKDWLHDLKTTRAKQGECFLKSDTGWCCLGRALHVMRVKGEYCGVSALEFEGETQYLSEARRGEIKLRNRLGNAKQPFMIDGFSFASLSEANDSGCTFKEIAAAIEADPENFFTNND